LDRQAAKGNNQIASKRMKTLEVKSAEEWHTWLADHHHSETEVWLVFQKRCTGKPSIGYEAAVDEALCFGWVDSLIKRLDDARYARKFTPRKAGSRWSTANRKRWEQLKARGRLTPVGAERAPTGRSGDAPRPNLSRIPTYIRKAFREDRAAGKHFESLAPSYQRMYIGWIDSAKRQETKLRRLREAVALLAGGKKLGLK
jgi:uncharacterized protein YdeI (YjbR/CyaY-like superfamily)